MTQATDSKILDRSEWDFSMIPAEFIDLAFFYEFSRDSKKMKNAVVEYKKLHPYFMTEPFDFGDPLTLDQRKYNAAPDFERNQIDMLDRLFKENAFIHVIDWLSFCPSFPEKPFSLLDENEFLNKRRVPTNIRGLHSLADRGSNGKAIQSPPAIKYTFPELGDVPGIINEKQSLHLTLIDWRKTNAELIDDFREWIICTRHVFGAEHTHRYARGLYNKPIPFPPKCKKKETALDFLGALRKKNVCDTWPEYMENFCHNDSELRDEKKKVAGAKHLINWVESNI